VRLLSIYKECGIQEKSKLITVHRLFHLHRETLCNRVKSFNLKMLRLVQLLQARKEVGKNTKEALRWCFTSRRKIEAVVGNSPIETETGRKAQKPPKKLFFC
jgi:hypothetical protein